MKNPDSHFGAYRKSQCGITLMASLAFALCGPVLAADKKSRIEQRPEVRVETYMNNLKAEVFVQDMQKRGLDADWVRAALNEARKLESVQRAVIPGPAGGQRKNWQAYRDRFVNAVRTEAGKAFLRQYERDLQRAHERFGVPVGVILGVLGVETFYGRNTGSYRVVESLATLAFDYPEESGRNRSSFFREQLAQFFMWCAREQCQPLEVKGSYAGAMGLPQFMPGNIEPYAVDFDSDGHVNLYNPVDAIGSVANFLSRHGWVRDLVPVYQVGLHDARMETLLEPDIVPTFRPWQLADLGVSVDAPISQWEKYALIELQNGDAANDYYLGSQNFFVLTRYNRSSYYAMAVLTLGQEVIAGEQGFEALSQPHAIMGDETTKARAETVTWLKIGLGQRN